MLLTIATLVIVGIALMILETFVPGWIVGILGGLAIVTAVILVLVSDEFASWPSWGRTATALGIIVVSGSAMLLWMRFFGLRLWRKSFTLESTIPSQEPASPMPLGTEGTAITELRPMGRADFGGSRREVRCEDGFAPEGARLRVTGAEPGNLLVRLVPAYSPPN
jgi:membrane-bound serine protease (ClpP class)